jgi:hypothetical protein
LIYLGDEPKLCTVIFKKGKTMTEKKEKPVAKKVVDSPLPPEEKPQAAPVHIDHELVDTIEELKSAGIAVDVINANIPLVRKLQRGVWDLEFTVNCLKGDK